MHHDDVNIVKILEGHTLAHRHVFVTNLKVPVLF
jgi:hypothetical protein